MVVLKFCNTHNMVTYLHKPDESEGLHQILDFLNASYIRYALSKNLMIYLTQISQFWRTASVKTLDNGEIELNAMVDGIVMANTESFVEASPTTT